MQFSLKLFIYKYPGGVDDEFLMLGTHAPPHMKFCKNQRISFRVKRYFANSQNLYVMRSRINENVRILYEHVKKYVGIL